MLTRKLRCMVLLGADGEIPIGRSNIFVLTKNKQPCYEIKKLQAKYSRSKSNWHKKSLENFRTAPLRLTKSLNFQMWLFELDCRKWNIYIPTYELIRYTKSCRHSTHTNKKKNLLLGQCMFILIFFFCLAFVVEKILFAFKNYGQRVKDMCSIFIYIF